MKWQPFFVSRNAFFSLLRITPLPFGFIQPSPLIYVLSASLLALCINTQTGLYPCFCFFFYLLLFLPTVGHSCGRWDHLFKRARRQKVPKRLSSLSWLASPKPQWFSVGLEKFHIPVIAFERNMRVSLETLLPVTSTVLSFFLFLEYTKLFLLTYLLFLQISFFSILLSYNWHVALCKFKYTGE